MSNWVNSLTETYSHICHKEQALNESVGTTIAKNILPPVAGGVGGYFAPDLSNADQKTKDETRPSLTVLGALLPYMAMNPKDIPRMVGEVGGQALADHLGIKNGAAKFGAEAAGTYLGGQIVPRTINALTGLQLSSPNVLGSIGFVGGDKTGEWMVDKFGVKNPWAKTGIKLGSAVAGDITGTAAQNLLMTRLLPRFAPSLAAPLTAAGEGIAAAAPVAGTVAAGIGLGGAAAYGINAALGGTEYANRMFDTGVWKPSEWAKSFGSGPQINPKTEEAWNRMQREKEAAATKTATTDVEKRLREMQGQTTLKENKLSDRESLHRRMKKQKYKVTYLQDGKKVEVFASSIRGVRRVIYGKKHYRVHSSSGSDMTGYFKKHANG